MNIIPAIALAALTPLGAINTDPGDTEDLAAVDYALTTPEFRAICADAPSTVWDLYLSDAFAVGEDDIAAEMYVAWLVEQFEFGYGHNLTETAEQAMVDALMDCTR